MAISIHTATVFTQDLLNFYKIQQDLVNAPNSSGTPSVTDYLALEAGSGYLPITNITGPILVTAKVADINAS